MRTVRGPDGMLYVVVKESGESSRVRDPTTGDEQFLPNDDLDPAGGESPFAALARGIPESTRRVVGACHEDWHLGVLVALADRGPLPARELLAASDACESDFLGAVTEFRAAGLVEEATIGGERGYALTEAGAAGVAVLRD
jgi:hypothetical protein